MLLASFLSTLAGLTWSHQGPPHIPCAVICIFNESNSDGSAQKKKKMYISKKYAILGKH